MGQAWLLSDDALATGLSAAFHVSMKDGSGIPLDVEVFCVRFVNREGRAAYFVGIREFTDTSPMLKDSTPETQHGGRFGGSQCVPLEGSRLASIPTEDSSHSSQESSNVSSEALSLYGEIPLEVEPTAWIDVLTPFYSVRHCTPAFLQYVDIRGGELLSAVRRSQQDDFISWVQEAYVALLEEDSNSTHLQYHTRLQFKSPAQQGGAAGATRSAQTRRVISAILRLDLTQPPDGQDHGRGLVRIVLQDSKLGRGVPRGPHRRSRCSGTPPSTAGAASGRLRSLTSL